jgi:hypothetical protein
MKEKESLDRRMNETGERRRQEKDGKRGMIKEDRITKEKE